MFLLLLLKSLYHRLIVIKFSATGERRQVLARRPPRGVGLLRQVCPALGRPNGQVRLRPPGPRPVGLSGGFTEPLLE